MDLDLLSLLAVSVIPEFSSGSYNPRTDHNFGYLSHFVGRG
jgi:hypothetical protein